MTSETISLFPPREFGRTSSESRPIDAAWIVVFSAFYFVSSPSHIRPDEEGTAPTMEQYSPIATDSDR